MGSTKPEKKEKKDKSAKRSEADGVSKSSKVKGDKKEKKDKKDKLKSAVLNAALDDKLQADAAAQSLDKAPEVTEVEVEDDDGEKTTKHVVGALVPFARPLAEDKGTKKILKSVRKGKSFYTQSHFPPHLRKLHARSRSFLNGIPLFDPLPNAI